MKRGTRRNSWSARRAKCRSFDSSSLLRGLAQDELSEAKECYYDAIGLARRLGLVEETEALEKRLEHIKAVFRSQFT